MKNIIYFRPEDAEKFDFARFKKSLNKYAKISDAEIKAALETVDQYENMHVSVLVELGVSLIMKNGSEEKAEEYFNSHSEYFSENRFERLLLATSSARSIVGMTAKKRRKLSALNIQLIHVWTI